MDAGTKLARIRRCHVCPLRITTFPELRKFSEFCTAPGFDPERRLTLDDAFLEGAESNCPLGYWRGLTPVDLDAERAAQLARTRELTAKYLARIVDAVLVSTATRTELEEAVGRLTDAGIVTDEEVASDIVEAVDESRRTAEPLPGEDTTSTR